MGIDNPEAGPSEADKNFRAPEMGQPQRDLREDVRSESDRLPEKTKRFVGSIDRESIHRVEAQHAARRAEHYRREAANSKRTAQERYEYRIQARAEDFFADHPGDDASVLKAFEEENPGLYGEWKKVTRQMTAEQIEQAKRDVGGMKVS